MEIFKSLSARAYYSTYRRKFAHYYDVYYTNTDKIDRIMIDSLQKGFKPEDVLSTLDQTWKDCIQREKDYQDHDGESITSHEAYFELYLRNVLRKILVFDEFDRVFSVV